MTRIDVLGVDVDALEENDVLQFVRSRLSSGPPAQIATVNAEFVMLARRHPEFAAVLRTCDLATPDGAGVVWAMRRAGVPQNGRVGGSDLIWSMSGEAARAGRRVFLLGGGPGVAAETGRRLQQRFPELQIAGTAGGSPAPEEDKTLTDLIRNAGTDILFVAFGAPAQELWIARNLRRSGARVAMGVGGTFDYVSGRARRAPVWVQRHGLDWLWRLAHQPWRWRRMTALPRFAWLVLRET